MNYPTHVNISSGFDQAQLIEIPPGMEKLGVPTSRYTSKLLEICSVTYNTTYWLCFIKFTHIANNKDLKKSFKHFTFFFFFILVFYFISWWRCMQIQHCTSITAIIITIPLTIQDDEIIACLIDFVKESKQAENRTRLLSSYLDCFVDSFNIRP